MAAFNSFALLRNPPPSLRASCRLRAKKSFFKQHGSYSFNHYQPNFPIGTYTVASFGESLSEPSHWARNIWGGVRGGKKEAENVRPSVLVARSPTPTWGNRRTHVNFPSFFGGQGGAAGQEGISNGFFIWKGGCWFVRQNIFFFLSPGSSMQDGGWSHSR